MTLSLKDETEFTRTYELADFRRIVIEVSDLFNEIIVKDSYGNLIGKTLLKEYNHPKDIAYQVIWMYLDQKDFTYKKQGIGRRCLTFFKELSGAIIVVQKKVGIQRNDGSHLTEDAAGFFRKMINEGIVEEID